MSTAGPEAESETDEGRSTTRGSASADPHRATHDVDPGAARRAIGWPRAVVSGIAIVVISFGLVVVLPNVVVSDLTSPGRDSRVLIALALCLVALGVIAWALRRLQARGLI